MRASDRREFNLQPQDTFFEWLILHIIRLPGWLNASLLLVFSVLPFVLAYQTGRQDWQEAQRYWRPFLLPAVITGYIIAAMPWVWRAEQQVIDELRPLASLDTASYQALVERAGRRTSWAAWGAFALGVVGGINLLGAQSEVVNGLLRLSPMWIYLWLAYLFTFGITLWSIYNAMQSARLTATVQRHIVDVDLFNLTPFETVGRQGLVGSLILIGGTTLSIILNYEREYLHQFLHWQNLALYLVLSAATVSVFFLIIWPTHRTLARVKAQKLLLVQQAGGRLFRQWEELSTHGAETQALSDEIQALLALEQRLKLVPTWPYTVEMLRTLLLSALTPLLVAASRIVTARLTGG